jgi:hypothetical protein
VGACGGHIKPIKQEVPVIKKLLQAAAVLAACSGAAHASTFDFSYTFGDGQLLTGSLDGTLSGELITDISNVSINFDHTTLSGTLYAGTFDSATSTYNYSMNAAVVSTNAALNNFIFADSNDPGANNVTNWFYFVNGLTPSGANGQEVEAANVNTGDIAFDNPGSGQWSLRPVPVPAALPLMVSGLGFLAGAMRRRQKKTA